MHTMKKYMQLYAITYAQIGIGAHSCVLKYAYTASYTTYAYDTGYAEVKR